MPINRKNFVDVDAYQRDTSLEQAAAACGQELDVTGSGRNVRIDCPFHCEGDHASKREIAVDIDNAAKQWKCHAYGCECRGNLLNLMYGWLQGAKWSGDKLRGAEFNEVKQVIAGEKPAGGTPPPHQATETRDQQPDEPKENPPLLAGEKSRVLMEPPIWEKLVTDVAAMSPQASAYVRRHPCLSSAAMKKWHVGYMPKDGGGDKRGWSLRDHIVYPYRNEAGEVVAFAGRDPKYDEKLREFEALPPEKRDPKKRPIKHKFPKGFHRGIELFGQERVRLEEESNLEAIRDYGLIIVEGFNDVIHLDNHNVPAVALCSNLITEEQVEEITRTAGDLGDGRVSLMLDCDQEGTAGAENVAWKLLEARLTVRAAWGRTMAGGSYADRQAESVSGEELRAILERLAKG